MTEAISLCLLQSFQMIGPKFLNPLYFPLFKLTGVSVSFTPDERVVDDNFRILRALIMDYVVKRRSGEVKSKVKADSDLLSLFFQSPEIFTVEFIVDELVDFFAAASQTTQANS